MAERPSSLYSMNRIVAECASNTTTDECFSYVPTNLSMHCIKLQLLPDLILSQSDNEREEP